MKCLNCGKVTGNYLCGDCQTPQILDKIFSEIRFFTPESCTNSNLLEYASGLSERYAERAIIPDILSLFDNEVTDFYYCQYYKMCKDSRLEEMATTYLNTHSITEIRTQNVLYDLIESYIPNDFVKPMKWCNIISETENLCCELYAVAAKYYAMIGEYDAADAVTEKAL